MRKLAMVPVAAALVVGGASLAAAAPPEPEVIPLVCDNGETYEAVVKGRGEFTPAHLGDHQVLVPIAFGDFVYTATPPDGDPVTVREPGSAKGRGNVADRNPRETLSCTFSGSFTLAVEEEGLPAGTVVDFSNEVTAVLVGKP